MLRFAAGQLAIVLIVLMVRFHDISSWFGMAYAFRNGRIVAVPGGTLWELIYDVLLLCLVPAIFSLLILAVLDYRKPLRLFQRGTRSGWRQLGAGIFTGVISLVLASVPLVYAERFQVPDWSVLCATATIATIVVLLFVRRVQPGLCVQCGFDIRASLDAGRCPECGAALTSPGLGGS